MKAILKDGTELEVTMVRANSWNGDFDNQRTVITLSDDLARKHTTVELRGIFAGTNLDDVKIVSKKNTQVASYGKLVDILYILNDYEEKIDIVLAEKDTGIDED